MVENTNSEALASPDRPQTDYTGMSPSAMPRSTSPNLDGVQSEASRPLLVVNFESGGHYHQHLCHLVRFGLDNARTAVRFLLPRKLRHDVMRELSPEQAAFFCSRASDLEEDDGWQKVRKLTSRKNLAVCLFTEWLNHRERHKSRLLFMHLESAMYLLALSPLPRYQVSGLMSRPMFHYRREGLFVKSKDSWLLFALKYLAARAFARRTGFERIFVMDPWAQKYAASRWHTKRFQLVPDPYGPEPGDPRPIASSEPMAERPLTLLIAGALAPRKGIHSTVDALSRAAESTRRGVRVRLVGEPEPGQADYVSQNIRRLKDLGVEVVADLRFVDDDELDMCIAEAHIVLTPYINPRTSSGILYRAAHFGTPIISNDRGLLGRLVSMHKLGKAIDTTDPDVYARCLEEVVTTGLVMGFEPESARRLADGSSPPVFAAAFLAERV